MQHRASRVSWYFIFGAVMISLQIPYFIHTNQVRASSYPFISGDTFRSIANHIMDETTQSLLPENVAPYDIIFVKTDYVLHFFETLHHKINNPYILITHNSDLSPIYRRTRTYTDGTTDLSRYLDDAKLIAWFAQNIDYVHPKLKPIPIGLANSYWTHGNIELFKNALDDLPAWETRSHLLYLNVDIKTNPTERKPIVDLLSQQAHVYHAAPKPPAAYLHEMKQYRFVVCPHGNGTDCHRAWEALLLGCTPIIQHSLLDSMFEGLPVILIHDWTDITEEFLERQNIQIQTSPHRLEKIYAQYWIRLIKNAQACPSPTYLSAPA